jgi:pSer/pThr/pTyr-binding forkhead associated (FHA) protein
MSSDPPRTTIQSNSTRPAFGAQLGTKAFLVVVSSMQFGLLCVLGEGAVTIGRGKECQIRLDDPTVSTEHCRVSTHPDKGFVIEDCGSTNGTRVNGRRIERPVELSYGDRIRIGSTIVRFYMEEIPNRPPR